MSSEVRVARFPAVPASAAEVRRFVRRLVPDEPLAEPVSLCATELATNAVLHTRAPFDVAVARVADGVRVDVIDARPRQVPAAVPVHGAAADITVSGTTGRGLQIVAALARRWGVSTSDASKSVWAELAESAPAQPTAMILEIGHREAAGTATVLRLCGMPTRMAVASGMHVDELVRDLQLEAGDVGELYALLDASAPARLAGRHAALRAAADDQPRFDLDLHATEEMIQATLALRGFLAEYGPPAAVDDFRAWIEDEIGHQLRGNPPRPCSLPA